MINLADKLNESLMMKPLPRGLHYLKDRSALLTALRRSQRFIFDDNSSRLIAEASIEIADYLDEARKMAIPPFPYTFVQIDNVARITKIHDMGIPLTRSAKIDPVPDVGWLIERHQTQHTAYRASYVCLTDLGMLVSPWAWSWDITDDKTCPWDKYYETDGSSAIVSSMFGMHNPNVHQCWMTTGYADRDRIADKSFSSAVTELSGELRHIFGFLTLLNQIPQEVSEPKRSRTYSASVVGSDKKATPLEYRDAILRLPQRKSLSKIIKRACLGIRKRYHPVRTQWRTFKKTESACVAGFHGPFRSNDPEHRECLTCGSEQTLVKSHWRGHKELGIIDHRNYMVKGPKP